MSLDVEDLILGSREMALGPGMFLPLDSLYGASDLTFNQRNGAAQGGLSIGGYTTTLPGGLLAATDFNGSSHRISTTYNPFTAGTVRSFSLWAHHDTSRATRYPLPRGAR